MAEEVGYIKLANKMTDKSNPWAVNGDLSDHSGQQM
jgi:hypothetical protein